MFTENSQRAHSVRAAFLLLSGLMLAGFLAQPLVASELRLYVPAENGHPADTLYVGYDGFIYAELTLSESDSVDAVVFALVLSGAGPTALLQPLTGIDLTWLSSYGTLDANGFNTMWSDGVYPDTLLAFASRVMSGPASPADSLIARLHVHPQATGTLFIDTTTIADSLVENLTALVLTAGGYRPVGDGLSFSAAPTAIVECPTVSVQCTSILDTSLCGETSVCVDVSVPNATDVTVTGDGAWSNGVLCVETPVPGLYYSRIIASNQCSADTCEFHVNVTFSGIPTITCPSDTLVAMTEPSCEVHIPLVISSYDTVWTDIGEWVADSLRLLPDTSGLYGIHVTAEAACGVDACTIWIEAEVGCCQLGGDIDHSGSLNVSDLTYLVAYLFGGGPPPECSAEGDVDGSGSHNVSDLTFIVSYLFSGGPAPTSCCDRQ